MALTPMQKASAKRIAMVYLSDSSLRTAAAKSLLDAYADVWVEPGDPRYPKTMELRDLRYRDRKWYSLAQWLKLMKTAVPYDYNEFKAKKVARWLAKLQKKHGTIEMQPGREGSVVVYIKGSPHAMQAILEEGKKGAAAVDESMEWRDGTIRLWWD